MIGIEGLPQDITFPDRIAGKGPLFAKKKPMTRQERGKLGAGEEKTTNEFAIPILDDKATYGPSRFIGVPKDNQLDENQSSYGILQWKNNFRSKSAGYS